MKLPPFTPETARAAAAKSLETRRRNRERKRLAALSALTDANQADSRNTRLWATLEDLDTRVSMAIKAGELDQAAKLANIAKIIRGQIEPSNGAGSAKRAAAPPPPDLPEPTA